MGRRNGTQQSARRVPGGPSLKRRVEEGNVAKREHTFSKKKETKNPDPSAAVKFCSSPLGKKRGAGIIATCVTKTQEECSVPDFFFFGRGGGGESEFRWFLRQGCPRRGEGRGRGGGNSP